MAESGRITLDVSSTNYITGYIEWSESDVSIEDNTSVVTASLVYSHGGGVATGNNSSDFYLVVNGNRVERTNGYTLYPGNTYNVLTQTVTVQHDVDGSKSIRIEGGGGIKGTTGLSASSGGATVALTTIFRTVWVKVSGAWKRAIPYWKSGNAWRQALPNVKSGSNWKIGV